MPLGYTVAAAAILSIVSGLLIEIIIKRGIQKRKKEAQTIAKSLWTVSGTPEIEADIISIKFSNYSWATDVFFLEVLPSDPDIQRFKNLNDGDIVEFIFNPDGGTWTLRSRLSLYLRIVSVRNPS